MKKHILSMLCVLLCALNVSAIERMTWEDKQYHYLYGDFNGDKVPDLFLQSLSEQTSSLIIIGQTIDGNTQYLVENEVTLPDIVDGHLWNNTEANITIFDHNHDGLSDIFIVIYSQKTALVVNGDENDIDFSNIAHSYSKKEFKWLKKSDKYVLYAEDFNGDNQHDLLAVSEKNNTHYLMHASDANSLSVVQEIKKSLKWAKKSDVDVKIADFNDDGKADVFAVARAKNTKHYLTYADENGLLGETTVIKEKVNNKDWNADDYSFIVTHADADETLDLVRLNNMPGGIDENGELIEAETGDDVDDITNDCDQLFYSVENQSEGESCAPWNYDSSETTPTITGNSKSQAQSSNITMNIVNQFGVECTPLDPCGEINPPVTPSSSPSVDGGSYHPYGSQIRVRYNAVPAANYYEVYLSTYNGGYSRVAATTSLSTLITIRNSWGYNYIKYKACNGGSGCSGFSPWKRVQAYNSPYTMGGKVSASPTSVSLNGTSTISWTSPGHILWSGTHYERKYTKPNGSTVYLSNVNHIGGTNNYSFTSPSLSIVGTYTFYIRACNPGLPCGGWGSANVTVNPPIPSPPSISLPSSDSDGTYTVSWSSVSYATSYELVGENSGTIYTGSSLSRSRTKPNGSYSYKVRACNSSGCSNYSPTKTIIVNIPDPIPSPPSISLPSSDSDGTYTVSWSSVSYATSYELNGENSGIIYTGSALSRSRTKPNGSYSYKVRACNSSGCSNYSSTKTIVVDIPSSNFPPIISGTPPTTATVGALFSFTAIATDENTEDVLEFSITGMPTWAEFDEATGTLTGTPQASSIGIDSNIVISVTDNIIAEPVSLETFDIEVQNSIVSYTYDARGRLVKVKNNSGKQISYSLDDAGNRITTGNED